MGGSQTTLLKLSLKKTSRGLQDGSRMQRTWESVVEVSMSMSHGLQQFSPADLARVSLRVAFLKHESSTKRRISQDLRVRDSKIGQASRIPTGTTTPPIVVPPIRSEIISPTGGRTTSSTSAIPETPQHVHGSKIGSTSLASSHALRSVASKSSSNTGDISQIAATPTVTQDEPSQSVASNASQVDDDMRRKSSLESMVSI